MEKIEIRSHVDEHRSVRMERSKDMIKLETNMGDILLELDDSGKSPQNSGEFYGLSE